MKKFQSQTGAPPALALSIARWQAWAPDGPDDGDWLTWLGATHGADIADAKPDVSFLPALLRRRLDRSGRMALAVAGGCLAEGEAMPAIFASRHGPLHRTVELLETLVRDEPLSPALFSLAVHNGVAGLFSIARADTSPNTSVAAGPATLAAAFWEAAGQLADGAKTVLLVYVSEPVLEIYIPCIAADEPLFAWAGILGAAAPGTSAWTLAPCARDMAQEPEYALLRALCGQTTSAQLAPGWALTRARAYD